MVASNAHRRAATPGAAISIDFANINDLLTCQTATFDWVYDPPVTDTGYNPNITILIGFFSDINTNTIDNDPAPSQLVLTSGVAAGAEQYIWNAVDVPQGQYELLVTISGDYPMSNVSNTFNVYNGSDISCLDSSPSISPPIPSASSLPTASSTSSSLPSQSSATSSGSNGSSDTAISATSSVNKGAIAGGIVAAVVVLLAVLGAYVYFYRKARRTSTSRRAQMGAAAGGSALGVIFGIGKASKEDENSEVKGSPLAAGGHGWKGAKWNGLDSVDLQSSATAGRNLGRSHGANDVGMTSMGYHRSTTSVSPSVASSQAPSPEPSSAEPYAIRNDSYLSHLGGRSQSISQSILSSSHGHAGTAAALAGAGEDEDLDISLSHSDLGHGLMSRANKRVSSSSSVPMTPISPTTPTPPAITTVMSTASSSSKKKTPRKPVPSYDAKSVALQPSSSETLERTPSHASQSSSQLRTRSKSVASPTAANPPSSVPLMPSLSHGHYVTRNGAPGEQQPTGMPPGKDVHYLIPDMPLGFNSSEQR